MGLFQNRIKIIIWISGKIIKVSEIMPITNRVLKMSKISQIWKIVKTMDFHGSRFHGNVRNIV